MNLTDFSIDCCFENRILRNDWARICKLYAQKKMKDVFIAEKFEAKNRPQWSQLIENNPNGHVIVSINCVYWI